MQKERRVSDLVCDTALFFVYTTKHGIFTGKTTRV